MSATLPIVEPMTPRQFKALRERLGLSQERLGSVLNRTGETIKNWENADRDIDPTAALAIRKLVEDHRSSRKPAKKASR